MTDPTQDKYKMFRNYMANELGITRYDIEAWVKEGIATEVQKLVGRVNVEGKIDGTINEEVRKFFRDAYGRPSTASIDLIKAAITKEISGQVIVSLTPPKREAEV